MTELNEKRKSHKKPISLRVSYQKKKRKNEAKNKQIIMIDPSALKKGQKIVLKQNSISGKWQEFIVDEHGRILAVEDVKLFEKSKLESQQPNNYEELKKNYQYLSKKEELTPPISINEDLLGLDNENIDMEEEEPDQEIKEQEKERDCEVKEKEN